MGIDVRANVVFPELRAPTNAKVALGQGEEGRMFIVSTVSAELEETPTLQPLSSMLASCVAWLGSLQHSTKDARHEMSAKVTDQHKVLVRQ